MSQIGQQIEWLTIMSQTDFGTLFDVSAMALSRWERGVNPPESRFWAMIVPTLGILQRRFPVKPLLQPFTRVTLRVPLGIWLAPSPEAGDEIPAGG